MFITLPILSALLLTTTLPALSDDFRQCLIKLEQAALKAGISTKTINAGLKEAHFLPEVIQLDRHQPEFQKTFAQYINSAVSASRLERGVILLKQHKTFLDKLRDKYGVPPQILVAFWGLESNFGNNLGEFIITDALVTLACDKRRSKFFTAELIAALQLMDIYGFKKDDMIGSWAGAIGQTQFLPSNYLKYAGAHDKKSTPDLWSNLYDALTSAAIFLSALGWKKNGEWGHEVYVPNTFNYLQSGLGHKKTLAGWQNLGIKAVLSNKIRGNDISASLILPGGHQNAAFLVYNNFHIIMKWNRSIFYALSIGYFADRLIGHKPLHKELKDEGLLAKIHIEALQKKLNGLGFTAGNADGLLGPATHKAITEFQHYKKIVADGYPSETVFKLLGIDRHLSPMPVINKRDSRTQTKEPQ
ncbi:MAG: lytic murein transglycosylase [Candidatus Endonucleobacter bathymodioli]|uniref:Lytic murein transglycosylase n=1 Tax=Candidatus Endonucleibacter bathymodioli TaxID=539814 RepID=A0AA90SUG2_9GAMM|nr:lytic murein transglycosylase [Candidatus Endonucleobacter bathymodioli]